MHDNRSSSAAACCAASASLFAGFTIPGNPDDGIITPRDNFPSKNRFPRQIIVTVSLHTPLNLQQITQATNIIVAYVLYI